MEVSNIYQTNSIVKPIKDMIEKCPFLDDFSININPMGFEQYPNEGGMSNQSLIDTGTAEQSQQIVTIDGVTGIVFKRIVSFMFAQTKNPDDSNVVDFRTNLVEWIAAMNEWNQVPRFSYQRNLDGSIAPYTWNKERMWATNAEYIGKLPDTDINVYNVDIHVSYIIKYESQGRCY